MAEPENPTSVIDGNGGMFTCHYTFEPTDGFDSKLLFELLSALKIRMSEVQFSELSEPLKKQFMVTDRKGRTYRYNSRQRQ